MPRVFEKIYNAADAKATGAKQKVFRLAAKTAIAYSRALDTPEGPSRRLKAQRAAFDRLVFSTLRSVLGGQVTHVVSGGGPLGERLGHFYRGAGVTVLEGYGLTETIGPVSVNTDWRIGSGGTRWSVRYSSWARTGHVSGRSSPWTLRCCRCGCPPTGWRK